MDIGPIIENTLLINERLSALLWELNNIDPKAAMGYHNELASMGFTCDFAGACIPNADEWPENVTECDLEEIFDAICEWLDYRHVPSYAFLGNHPHDGASFGLWPDHDHIEMAIQDGDLLSCNDLSEIPSSYTGGYVLVNDHGNISYGYALRGESIDVFWSAV